MNDTEMRLRPYKSCDAKKIVSWIRDEEALYKWSADRYNKYPISADDINHKYLKCNGDCEEEDNFYPLTAEVGGRVIGHLMLRYTNGDKNTLRVGFVIVDDSMRGQGYGKKMLKMAEDYAFGILKAKRLTLGVFENNPSAYHCYKAAGFCEIKTEDLIFEIKGEKWRCIEMEMRPKSVDSDAG